jgi:uncharacterized protein (DUF362 family)
MEDDMADKITRREFLQKAGIIGVTTVGLGLIGGDLLGLLDEAEAAERTLLAIASGGSPETLVKKAIGALGGIKKFVKKGSFVVIKPNLAWSRTPDQAANTNPQVISAVIKLCRQAGAGRIVVLDHTCDSPGTAVFEMNGAAKACSAAGVRLISADNRRMYRRINIPKGKVLKSDECVKEILDADVFINMPIAKVHGASNITASMKNLMGTNWDRGAWHRSDLDQCIADYASAVRSHLIVLDCTRVLLTRGPKGPGETKDVGIVAASTDPVATDAYAATVLGKDPKDIGHIVRAAGMGLGQIDLKKVSVKKV